MLGLVVLHEICRAFYHDGKSWSGGLLLDERTAVSYPDIAQSPDGDIYVCQDNNTQPMHLWRFGADGRFRHPCRRAP